jgi:membrane protease YdiL (CAAX protease family)
MLPEKPWKPDLVVLLLCALLLSMMLGALVVQGYGHLAGSAETNPHRELILFVIGVVFFFHGVGLALVNVFLRLHHSNWTEAFGFNAPRLGRTIFLSVVMAIVVLPVALSLTELSARVMRQFQMPVEPQQAVRVVQSAVSRLDLIVHGIAAILIAPFVEELVFRGIVYPAAKKNGSRTLALWGTSLFFALMHGNLMIVLPLTVLAIFLTFLYETTTNLLAPIITHSLFNAANFSYLVWQQRQQGLL